MAARLRPLVVLVLLLAACALPGPRFAQVAGTLPPIERGDARIFFYRQLELYDTMAATEIYLNGAPAGVSETGAVLYRDVPAGRYVISVESGGVFPNQFKTVVLKPDEVLYARIESLRAWSACGKDQTGCYDTFTVEPIDPQAAQAELRDLRLIGG